MSIRGTHEAQENLLFPVVLGLFDLPFLYYSEFSGVFQEEN